MAEYINRELLLNDLETSIVVSGRTDVAPLELRGVHKVVDRIKAMPTEDVVPVVRCKDCKHFNVGVNFQSKPILYCRRTKFSFETKPDDYCSYGERKCDDGNL